MQAWLFSAPFSLGAPSRQLSAPRPRRERARISIKARSVKRSSLKRPNIWPQPLHPPRQLPFARGWVHINDRFEKHHIRYRCHMSLQNTSSHGVAAAVLAASRHALERIGSKLEGPWASYISWIDERLGRLWRLQGPAPGLGVTLPGASQGIQWNTIRDRPGRRSR